VLREYVGCGFEVSSGAWSVTGVQRLGWWSGVVLGGGRGEELVGVGFSGDHIPCNEVSRRRRPSSKG
jgi:hypothetical protein